MKKTLSLVLALITLLFCLVGCNNSKEIVLTDEDIHTDYAGVYLTLRLWIPRVSIRSSTLCGTMKRPRPLLMEIGL